MTSHAGIAGPVQGAPTSSPGWRKLHVSRATRRALITYTVTLLAWQLCATVPGWLGLELPVVGSAPAPSEVLSAASKLALDASYWHSVYLSLVRVLFGFVAAMVVGV